jgi:hypothetical protein
MPWFQRLIQERYPEPIADLIDLVAETPPGQFGYEAIFSSISGNVDAQLLTVISLMKM